MISPESARILRKALKYYRRLVSDVLYMTESRDAELVKIDRALAEIDEMEEKIK